ncbi:hypothetical protein D3C80_289910 [compost metagenome]
MGVAHFAFDLGLGYQGCHGVDDDHVDGVGAHQHVGDFQGLLAGVRLGNQQVIDVHPELAGVVRVQGVFGVDEGTGGAHLLGFGDDGEGQGGLAGGFGTVDLDDTAFRQAADAEGDVQAQGAGGNGRDGLAVMVAHAHYRALAELLFDLAQGSSQRALLVLVH